MLWILASLAVAAVVIDYLLGISTALGIGFTGCLAMIGFLLIVGAALAERRAWQKDYGGNQNV